jgi:pimeloyl-ACP methyl ester carboxylesterase
MRRPRLVWALVCVLVAGAAVSGCGQESQGAPPIRTADSGVPLQGDFTGSGEVAGALTSANTLPTVDRRLRRVTSLAARIEYTSTSGITGGHTQVTGTVFVPRGKAPDGGWRIVAFGHATTGIGPDCAPSLSPALFGSAEVVTAMVRAGYVVVMPDYQGLGLDTTYHPYLDSTTVGYNMIDSVRAARKLVPDTSKAWVALGLSEGAQASWAANELAADYGGGVVLIGSVSLSPPVDITGFADAAASGTLTKQQEPVLPLILAALKNEYPDFNLADYRRGIVADQWAKLLACDGSAITDRAKVTDQITADDLRPSSPEAVETLRGDLKKMSLPQGPAASPMLVVYGGRDELIPAAWTEHALTAACALGDVIDIRIQPDRGHNQIDVSMAFGWITDRFSGVPASNSCESFEAANRAEAAVPEADQSE